MNGHTAALTLEPAAAPVSEQARKPDTELGIAVASAACALCLATEEGFKGRVTGPTKMAGAERLAQLVHLKMAALDEAAWDATARREGLVQLRRHLDADFRKRHGPNGGDATLVDILVEVLGIVQKVIVLEKILRAN